MSPPQSPTAFPSHPHPNAIPTPSPIHPSSQPTTHIFVRIPYFLLSLNILKIFSFWASILAWKILIYDMKLVGGQGDVKLNNHNWALILIAMNYKRLWCRLSLVHILNLYLDSETILNYLIESNKYSTLVSLEQIWINGNWRPGFIIDIFLILR